MYTSTKLSAYCCAMKVAISYRIEEGEGPSTHVQAAGQQLEPLMFSLQERSRSNINNGPSNQNPWWVGNTVGIQYMGVNI